jgi:hypothetical protein
MNQLKEAEKKASSMVASHRKGRCFQAIFHDLL